MREKILKYLPFAALAIITIALAVLSIISDAGDTSLYSSPLMIIGWCIVAVSASYRIFGKRKKMSVPAILIHFSFLIILVGALFSHFSESGIVHLREGETKDYAIKENRDVMKLPFSITLQKFEIEYYHLSDAPKDFVSYVETHGHASHGHASHGHASHGHASHGHASDGRASDDNASDDNASQDATPSSHRISMNKVLDMNGYRLFQTSFDEDGKGSLLTISHDYIGSTITYFGYALLALSMVLFLFGKRSYFRQILRDPLWKTFTVLLLLGVPTLIDAAPRTFPKGKENSNVAEMFGRVRILYNGRVTLMETYALDFTRKLTGKNSYGEYDATQVLAGWIFAPEDWRKEKMIKSKYGMLDFDSAVEILKKGMTGKVMTKEFDKLDEKIGLILDLQSGNPLKIFPRKSDSLIVWETPSTIFKGGMQEFVARVNESTDANYVKYNKFHNKYDGLWGIWYGINVDQGYILNQGSDWTRMQKLKAYAEHVYNRYCNTAPLAYASLTLGLLSFFCLLRRKLNKFRIGFSIVSAMVFIGISIIIGIRAFISGRFPMSNGYETMLFISWISFATTIFAGIKIPLVMPAGFFIGGFALLVSKLGMMNPEITPLMPVLASPWMSIHVTLMMLSYTFFAFMAFNSAATLVMARNRAEHQDTISRLVLLNRFLLYPSTFMLAIGMFIGAVWANESWGSYWSWDPKETWALITMIVYAMAFHRESISWMKRDLFFQTYLLVCFGSIIMTYFGVNYLLGGMHSYAG